MDINIKKYIDLLKEKSSSFDNKEIIDNILSDFLKNEPFNYTLKKGTLFLKNISPILRTKIKLKKEFIINECKNNNITIRDII